MNARRRWRRRLLWAAAAAVAVVAAVWIGGALRWRQHAHELQRELLAGEWGSGRWRYDPDELMSLPACVQRYFRAVLRPGQVVIASAFLHHRGTMNLAAEGESWVAFTSAQLVTPQRPGFVWEACVDAAGVPAIRVVDAYVGGEGRSEAALFGLVPLGSQRGRGDVAVAQLQRFLAEAAWYPTALLPKQGVQWTALGERQAAATLRDGEVAATLTFTFGDDDRIESVHAEARGRRVGDRLVPTPWTGRFWDYAEQDGVQVPMQAEVGWDLPVGSQPYWRGWIESLSLQ